MLQAAWRLRYFFPEFYVGGWGVAGWERAGAEREHAAEAAAACAAGLHGSGGALLGVACSRGEGGPPASCLLLWLLENGAVSVPRFTSPRVVSLTLLPCVDAVPTRHLPDAGRGGAAPVPSRQAAH
jgi:hypothetical protein